MSLIIKGGTSGVLADVDVWKNLQVNLPLTAEQAGFGTQLSEIDSGAVTGSRLMIAPETNNDYCQRIAQDWLTFEEKFVGTALNAGLWYQDLATMTVAVASAFCSLNNGGATASGNYAQIRSYALSPTLGTASTYFQFRAKTDNGAQANKVIELGVAFASGVATPTDGVFFRWTAAGELYGVLNNNGSEVTTAALTLPTDDMTTFFLITLTQGEVQFWIDDVLQGSIPTPAGANRPVRSASLPLMARIYNSGVPAFAAKLHISDIQMFQGGPQMGINLQTQMVSTGGQANQGQSGYTALGTQSNITNSLSVTTATLSNTVVPAGGYTGTTLGGRFQFAAPAGATTDFIIFAFQVPAGSAALQAKSLFVTDIRIETVNLGAAVATTPTVLAWTLGFGSSAVSLATADAATTKAPRRVPLGIQSFIVGALVGVLAPEIDMSFGAPIVIWPGQYLHIIVQVPVGTATSGQLLNGMVEINGFWR